MHLIQRYCLTFLLTAKLDKVRGQLAIANFKVVYKNEWDLIFTLLTLQPVVQKFLFVNM